MLYQSNLISCLSARLRRNDPGLSGLLQPFLVGLSLFFIWVFSASESARAQQNIVVEPVKTSVSMLDSTREQDGLMGPVRRVHTEMSKVTVTAGKVIEEPRMLLEVTTYDPQGKRIWNVYYPVNSASFKGNQEFTYDDKGHVKEMALRDDSGRILSREAYSYEYDRIGNWIRMTSSLVIFEADKIVHEPFEITTRSISYYFDDSVASIVKSPPLATGAAITEPEPKPKDNPALIPENSTPETKSEAIKQADSSDSTVPSSPSEKPLGTDKTTGDASINKAEQVASGVDVSSSGVQAYQMPDAQPTTATTKKSNVSGGVVSGKILRLPKPIYPAMALARGVTGKVVVEVTIDEKGKVIDARALSGNPILKHSAIYAAREARFEPTLLSGQPVKATRIINFDFNGR